MHVLLNRMEELQRRIDNEMHETADLRRPRLLGDIEIAMLKRVFIQTQ